MQGPKVPEDPVRGHRVHINVGFACNNNCIFCMEDDREGRYERISKQTIADVRRMLEAARGAEMVMFTHGEPTLNPDLLEYIKIAKEIGFGTIGLITNGRRLGYPKYTYQLLKAGLNHVLVSIHGPNAKVHDALTRTKGSFEQTLKGIKVLWAMKRVFPDLKIHTSFVITKRNMDYFKEFYDLVNSYVDQMVFNMLMPDGRGATYFKQLMPRYSEVVERFQRCLEQIPPRDVERCFLLDIPYCVTEGLPDSVRGYVERYFHFEPEDMATAQEVLQEANPYVEPHAIKGEKVEFIKVEKTAHDVRLRVKRPECNYCRYNRYCQGVFRIYVEHYGWDEFVPVRDVRSRNAKGAG